MLGRLQTLSVVYSWAYPYLGCKSVLMVDSVNITEHKHKHNPIINLEQGMLIQPTSCEIVDDWSLALGLPQWECCWLSPTYHTWGCSWDCTCILYIIGITWYNPGNNGAKLTYKIFNILGLWPYGYMATPFSRTAALSTHIFQHMTTRLDLPSDWLAPHSRPWYLWQGGCQMNKS